MSGRCRSMPEVDPGATGAGVIRFIACAPLAKGDPTDAYLLSLPARRHLHRAQPFASDNAALRHLDGRRGVFSNPTHLVAAVRRGACGDFA